MIKSFTKIGEYLEPNKDPVYKEFLGNKKSYKASIVYLLVVNRKIKYIGETRQGYMRPLSYNKNFVMKKQREGILKEISKGNKVEVFAFEVQGIKTIVNDLEIDCYLAQDYEKALIKKYKPEWNGRG